MKHFLILFLLVATTCFATERLVFLSGDSEVDLMSSQQPIGNGYVVTELTNTFEGSPICDMFPGSWVGNGAFAAYYAIEPDIAAFALGCNNGETPLPGMRFRGNPEGFLSALHYVLTNNVTLMNADQEHGEDGRLDSGNPHGNDQELPVRPIGNPKVQAGDVLHIWIQGTGGLITINGIETPCFYLAWPDNPHHPSTICEHFGGVIMVASYTGDSPDIIGLKQIIEEIDGGGKFILNLIFAHSGAWWACLGNYLGVAGCGANEYVYICDAGEENSMYWPGFSEPNFPMLEPTMWLANMWKGYRSSDGFWNPQRFDLNGDYHIWFSEGCIASGILDNQHGTVPNIPIGEDFKVWNHYPLIDPLGGGGGSPPAPEVYPNPFNPMTTIQIELQSAGMLEVSVFNIIGQRIVRLCDEQRPAGLHSFTFDGANLPSGIYFLQTVFNGKSQVKKMVLQK